MNMENTHSQYERDIPAVVRNACQAVLDLPDTTDPLMPYAKTYAASTQRAYQQYGIYGVRVQCLYILSNLDHISTPEVIEIKKILFRFADQPMKDEPYKNEPT